MAHIKAGNGTRWSVDWIFERRSAVTKTGEGDRAVIAIANDVLGG